MNKLKTKPNFKDEDKEREYWSKSDSTEYIDWTKAEKVRFSKLKPSFKVI